MLARRPLLLARSLLQQAAPSWAASGLEAPKSRTLARQMRVDICYLWTVVKRGVNYNIHTSLSSNNFKIMAGLKRKFAFTSESTKLGACTPSGAAAQPRHSVARAEQEHERRKEAHTAPHELTEPARRPPSRNLCPDSPLHATSLPTTDGKKKSSSAMNSSKRRGGRKLCESSRVARVHAAPSLPSSPRDGRSRAYKKR